MKNSLILIAIILFMIPSYGNANEQITKPKPNLADYDFELATPIKFETPNFPHHKINKKYGGWVHLKFKLKENGRAYDLEVIDSSPKGLLDKSVIKSLKRWKFDVPDNASTELVYQYLSELRYE